MSFAHASLKPKPALKWVAVFCALVVWSLGILAASPGLHAALHADADHADHSCAITLFSHGLDDSVATPCFVCAPQLFAAGKSPIQPAVPVADGHRRLPPGCGPPLR